MSTSPTPPLPSPFRSVSTPHVDIGRAADLPPLDFLPVSTIPASRPGVVGMPVAERVARLPALYEGLMVGPLSMAFYVSSVPFTEAVVNGETSLGGSESACLSVARALSRRGHSVTIFATQLDPSQHGRVDGAGVTWHPAEAALPDALKYRNFDVFCSLRMHDVLALTHTSKLNLLWAQDMIVEPLSAWFSQLDALVYVSKWHKAQWEAVDPVVKEMDSFITKNAFDAVYANSFYDKNRRLPADEAYRFIHVSRPERGLTALLALWPKIRERYPKATLSLCRYSSMYDSQGWGQICARFDDDVQALNREVGGLSYLGELTKPALYRAIADSHLMLYPTSQPGFGETHCIACVESQACGTPFLGSYRGALPEVLHPKAGRLIETTGDDQWKSEVWQTSFLDTLSEMLSPNLHASMRENGVLHSKRWAEDEVAETWEKEIINRFARRFAAQPLGILRRLLVNDDHGAAALLAGSLDADPRGLSPAQETFVRDALALCGRVARGEEQVAADYGERAIQDPVQEATGNARLQEAESALAKGLEPRSDGAPLRLLDLSCGNGAMLYRLRAKWPEASLCGVDYSLHNIELAKSVVTGDTAFHVADSFAFLTSTETGTYDGAFCGEFLEHVEHPAVLIQALERVVRPGGRIVYTTPCGPFAQLLDRDIPLKRGHVHSYTYQDIHDLFGSKPDFAWYFLDIGISAKGSPLGYWVVSYTAPEAADRVRHLARPLNLLRKGFVERPYSTITACMITRDCEPTILRTLESLWQVVDHLVVIDTGSRDDTIELIRSFALGAPDWADVTEREWPADFSVARNWTLDRATELYAPDYILWIDGDEYLDRAHLLGNYATGTGPFAGAAIRQYNFKVDQPNDFETPIRLFRTDRGARFYGVVHEQPEQSLDESIQPAVRSEGVQILHHGYHTGAVRTRKMMDRNLELLAKELNGQGTHKPRMLAYILAMRDYVNFALTEMVDNGNQLTQQAKEWLARCVSIYRAKKFDDPESKYHDTAFPYYQDALRLTKAGLEVAWGFAAASHELRGTPKAERMRFLSPKEIERELGHRIREFGKRLGSDGPICPPSPILPDTSKGYVAVAPLRPVAVD